jgi:multidrug resistance protein MdtO
MPARAERTHSSGFLAWLSYELAPKDGRGGAILRMAVATSLTVAIAMVFRIPEPAYMAYIVFLISRDEQTSTLVSAIGGLAAATLAIIATLGLSLIDLGDPAIRLPAMAAATFLAMYTVRVFALGPITYLAGFVIVLLQSVVDQVPSPEQLTRITLWVWVLLFVPIVITLVLNVLYAPSVELLRNREFKRMVGEVASALRQATHEIPLDRLRERVVELLDKKAHQTTVGRKRAQANKAVLGQLLNLLVLLEAATPDLLSRRGSEWATLLDEMRNFVGEDLPEPSPAHTQAHPVGVDLIGFAVDETIHALMRAFEDDSPPVESPKKPLLAKDATTNDAHWQFALKVTLAVMIVYSIYTLLDWPGLRTSIVTCFFVALGSLGETVHKLTLRLSGALLGGVIAGLCIVFVLPHLTDIGQLCLLIAVVSGAAAWLATSSEQLAYAGLQMAFAFFLGMLQSYAPANDLTVLRDRVVGIMLGNVVMTIVFSTLWPQSAAVRVRLAIAQVLRALSTLLISTSNSAANREQAARGLVTAEHFRTLRGFELQLVPGHTPVERIADSLQALAILEGRIFVSMSPGLVMAYGEEDRLALSQWASRAASAAESGSRWPSPPALPAYSAKNNDVMSAARATVESAPIRDQS